MVRDVTVVRRPCPSLTPASATAARPSYTTTPTSTMASPTPTPWDASSMVLANATSRPGTLSIHAAKFDIVKPASIIMRPQCIVLPPPLSTATSALRVDQSLSNRYITAFDSASASGIALSNFAADAGETRNVFKSKGDMQHNLPGPPPRQCLIMHEEVQIIPTPWPTFCSLVSAVHFTSSLSLVLNGSDSKCKMRFLYDDDGLGIAQPWESEILDNSLSFRHDSYSKKRILLNMLASEVCLQVKFEMATADLTCHTPSMSVHSAVCHSLVLAAMLCESLTPPGTIAMTDRDERSWHSELVQVIELPYALAYGLQQDAKGCAVLQHDMSAGSLFATGYGGYMNFIQSLLKAHASINIPNDLRRLPIELAVLRECKEQVELLVPLSSPIPNVRNYSIYGVISHSQSENTKQWGKVNFESRGVMIRSSDVYQCRGMRPDWAQACYRYNHKAQVFATKQGGTIVCMPDLDTPWDPGGFKSGLRASRILSGGECHGLGHWMDF